MRTTNGRPYGLSIDFTVERSPFLNFRIFSQTKNRRCNFHYLKYHGRGDHRSSVTDNKIFTIKSVNTPLSLIPRSFLRRFFQKSDIASPHPHVSKAVKIRYPSKSSDSGSFIFYLLTPTISPQAIFIPEFPEG